MRPLAESGEILVLGWVWRRARRGSDILEPAAEQPAIAPVVAGQAQRPIATPSAQRGRPAELPAARRARLVAGSARMRPGSARMLAAEQAVGYPAPARDAVPIGYPQVVRDPERAPRTRGRDSAVPAGGPTAPPGPRPGRDPPPPGNPPATPDPPRPGPPAAPRPHPARAP